MAGFHLILIGRFYPTPEGANEFNLKDEWLLDRALQTLYTWKQYPHSDERWGGLPGAPGIMLKTNERVFKYEHEGWGLEFEPWGEFIQRLQADLKIRLDEYRRRLLDLAESRGWKPSPKRFVSAQEPNEGRKYDVALLKTLSSGDTITTHRKFEHQFSFSPSHKLWIATNLPPVIPPDDPAIWARVKLIPFDVSFKGRENYQLPDQLKQEAPGILNWIIEGAIEWLANGLGTCDSVKNATELLRDDNDHVAQFINDRCDVGGDKWIRPQELYYAYTDWVMASGLRALSQLKFAQRLESRGFGKTKVQGSNRRNGLRLRKIEKPSPPPIKWYGCHSQHN